MVVNATPHRKVVSRKHTIHIYSTWMSMLVFGSLQIFGCSDDTDSHQAADASTPWLDAEPTPVDAAFTPTTDAAPSTDAQGGNVRVSWRMTREGVALSCAELAVSHARIIVEQWGEWHIELQAPCEDGFVIIDQLPLASYDSVAVLLMVDVDGVFVDRIIGGREDVIVDTHGETVHVPIVIEFFDEPESQMQQLFEAARAHYQNDTTTPRQFPNSTGTTPALGTCCTYGGVCQLHPDEFSSPAWTTLGFSVTGQSRIMYEFSSSGSDNTAMFTIRAHADNDCDGVFKEYQLHGWIDENGDVAGGEIAVIRED